MRRLPPLLLTSILLVAGCGDDTGTGPVPVTGIDVVAASDVIVVGRSMQLDVDGRGAGGESVPLGGSWSTSDPDVADVSAAGIVTGRGEGEAVITAAAAGHEARLTMRVAPDSLPIFTATPFEDVYDLWNAFDHDLPFWSGDSGQILTWLGFNVPGLEGHNGYDWPMPRGTPLFAVGDGVVGFAGGESPWSCPLLNDETVSALVVVIVHTAPSGERYMSIYIHLGSLDVESGETVVAGQQIGLSGNTGCSTGAHLHFEVRREFYHRTPSPGQMVVTDPNGWAGSRHDPWLLDGRGGASTHLWAAGAAPAFPLISMHPGPAALHGTTVAPTHMHRFSVPPLPPRPRPTSAGAAAR